MSKALYSGRVGGYQPRPVDPATAINVKGRFARLRDLGVSLNFGTGEGSTGQIRASRRGWTDLGVRELGIDPMTVIREMSSDAARFMGVERDTGTISEGPHS